MNSYKIVIERAQYKAKMIVITSIVIEETTVPLKNNKILRKFWKIGSMILIVSLRGLPLETMF